MIFVMLTPFFHLRLTPIRTEAPFGAREQFSWLLLIVLNNNFFATQPENPRNVFPMCDHISNCIKRPLYLFVLKDAIGAIAAMRRVFNIFSPAIE